MTVDRDGKTKTVKGDFHRDDFRAWVLKQARALGEDNGLDGHLEEIADRLLSDFKTAAMKTQRAGSLNVEDDLLCTDVANARRLMDRIRGRVRYCQTWRKFLGFDGRRWITDAEQIVVAQAKEVPQDIFREAAEAPNNAQAQELAGWGIRSADRVRIRSMIDLVKSEPGIGIEIEELDHRPMLFNVANGTIDLTTGELKEHDPDDLITQVSPVKYDPAAKCPTFDTFFEEIMPDEDARAYLRRALGYAMTGSVKHDALFICHGYGSNGKTTLFKIIEFVMGDYGKTAPPEILMAASQGQHPTGVADLYGRRLVFAPEIEQGQRLNEGKVKRLTGRDPIKARRMREDFWEFDPTHKLFLAVNHRPVVRGTDNGIWRRLKMLPFTQTFKPGENADEDLDGKLKAEAPGILNRLIEWCREWQCEGLAEPKAVKIATEEYRSEMDLVGNFLTENYIPDKNAEVPFKQLYGNYSLWCECNGLHPMAGPSFAQQLTERGYEAARSGKNGTRVRKGLKRIDDSHS